MESNDETYLLDREFYNMTLYELQQQRANCRSRVHQLQNEISNLAFNNYRTYADVGRMAEHCKEMFAEINQFMTHVKREFPQLIDCVEKFRESAEVINNEYAMLEEINSINSYVWELLTFPKLMDRCIRAGKYQTAYALTNFAVNIRQSKLIQNPMIKEVTNILIEARHGLLDELFNKFAGPIDLAKSIQVVNNIRKIPYISNTQLRVSILQYRDIYLEKNLLNISSKPDFALRIIEMYRDCMYDTVVLYMAVFPNNADFQRKHSSALASDDTRWERWTGSSQTYLLLSWAHRNIERMFGFLRLADTKSALDIEAMSGKLMSFAFSFGRMGLDFRSLVLHEFSQLIVVAFRQRVADAVRGFENVRKLDFLDGDIFESTLNELDSDFTASQSVASAPLELCIWDDLCVFGNQIIEALNECRHLLAVNYINQIFAVLKEALQSLFKCLDDRFLRGPVFNVDCLSTGDDKLNRNAAKSAAAVVDESLAWTKADKSKVRRAVRLLLQHFVPFVNSCFLSCFPYEKCGRLLFRDRPSMRCYAEFYSLMNVELFALCENVNFFVQVYDEVRNEADAAASTKIERRAEKLDVAINTTSEKDDTTLIIRESSLAQPRNATSESDTKSISSVVVEAEAAPSRVQGEPRDLLEDELESMLLDKNSSIA